jgi:hypothetical protein
VRVNVGSVVSIFSKFLINDKGQLLLTANPGRKTDDCNKEAHAKFFQHENQGKSVSAREKQ